MKRKMPSPLLLSPLFQVLMVATSIFMVEMGIMAFFLLVDLAHLNGPALALVDATVLVMGVFPALYFLLFRPLTQQILERQVAGEELAKSREKYRILFEHANDSILLVDPETHRLLDANENAAGRLGYTREELLEQSIEDLLPPGSPVRSEAKISRLGDIRSARFEAIHRCKDGTEIPVEVSSCLIEYNGRQVVLSFIRDIDERKRAEDEIRKLSSVVEQSPSTIIITDTCGNIQYVNPKFTQLTGYTLEEIIGRNPHVLKSGETPPEEYRKLWNTIRTGEEWRGEFHNKKKNGDLYWEFARISPLKDGSGKITHFMAIKEDITERKRIEGELRRSLAETAHNRRLLLALSRAAQAVHRAFTPDDVCRVVVQKLREAGYHATVLALTDDRTHLAISHVTFPSNRVGAAEGFTGLSSRPFSISLTQGSFFQRLLDQEEAVFHERLSELIVDALPEQLRHLADNIAAALGVEQGIFSPLMVEGVAYGLLIVSGIGLAETDLPAVSGFADQTAIAIEKARLLQRTHELAITDGLTGIYNHRHFRELLASEMKRAERYRRPLSLVMVDIDHFKFINDSYGHQTGDKVLKATAEVLRHAVRETDNVFRYGGEELAIILPETSEGQAIAMSERIRQMVEDHEFGTGNQEIRLTVSIGVASSSAEREDMLEILIRRADQALYEAKELGRNRVCVS